MTSCKSAWVVRWTLGVVIGTACGGADDEGTATGGGTNGGSTEGVVSDASTTGASGTTSADESGTDDAPGNDTPGADDNGPKCPPGEITPDELPMGTVGEPYAVTIDHGVPASAGDAELTGPLPPGLEAMAGPGVIELSGTPTMSGTFPLAVLSLTNDGGTCLPEKDYTLVIEEAVGTEG